MRSIDGPGEQVDIYALLSVQLIVFSLPSHHRIRCMAMHLAAPKPAYSIVRSQRLTARGVYRRLSWHLYAAFPRRPVVYGNRYGKIARLVRHHISTDEATISAIRTAAMTLSSGDHASCAKQPLYSGTALAKESANTWQDHLGLRSNEPGGRHQLLKHPPRPYQQLSREADTTRCRLNALAGSGSSRRWRTLQWTISATGCT